MEAEQIHLDCIELLLYDKSNGERCIAQLIIPSNKNEVKNNGWYIWYFRKGGFDVGALEDDAWDDAEGEWENECDNFLRDAIDKNKKMIIMKWATKLGLKKRDDLPTTKTKKEWY